MKNKLTSEEQALQSKLNEVDFVYQDSHWSELQETMNPTPPATFSPLLKAAAAFVLLTGSVYLINHFSTEPKAAKQEIKTEQPTKKEVIINPEIYNSKETTDFDLNDNETLKADKPETSTKVNQNSNKLSVKNKKSEQSNSKDEIISSEPIDLEFTDREVPTNEKEETFIPNVTLGGISLGSAACLNSQTEFMVHTNTNLSDNILFIWSVDGKKISGSRIATSYKFETAGEYTVAVNAMFEGKSLAAEESTIEVYEAAPLNFNHTDNENTFHDKEVSFAVIDPIKGTYEWTINQQLIGQGTELTHNFKDFGKSKVTLEHTSIQGCVTAVENTISVKEDFIVFRPDLFTPDGNGTNDEFELISLDRLQLESFQLKIYNMQNKLVFSSNEQGAKWNGRLNNNGPILPKGTYAWIVEIKDNKGFKKEFKDKVRLD